MNSTARMQEPAKEERTAKVAGWTWPSIKQRVREQAAREQCTVSEWMHNLLLRELLNGNGATPQGDTGARHTR